MRKIGSYAFSFMFMFGTLFICAVCVPFIIFPRTRAVMWTPHIWANTMMWCMKAFVGLRYEVKGWENLPEDRPFIIACKHQSAFETCVFHKIFQRICYIFKKSLGQIPFVGWHIIRSGSVSVDRSSGSAAMRTLLEGSQRALKEGYTIVIFPEGTRTAVGEKTEYNPGIAFLYDKIKDVDVIPAALNSGLFWPRYSWLKKPGTITIEFLPAIAKGLGKREFMKVLEQNIETATAKLVDQAKIVL